MRTQLNKSFVSGFLLSAPELTKLFEKMTQQMEKVTKDYISAFELSFANQVIAERLSIDAILKEENGGVWAIRSLKIVLNDKNEAKDSTQITLIFSANETDEPISYSILGDDQEWVYHTGAVLEERIDRVKKTSLGRLAKNSSSYASFATSLVLMPKLVTKLITEYSVDFLSKYFRDYDYIFYWGDYIKIYDKRQSFYRFLTVGIGLGLLISIIGSILAAIILLKLGIGQAQGH